MKRADIIKLVGICSANYRNWPEEGKEEATIILWLKMFGDMEYYIVEAAIEKYLSEGKFSPTIADIMTRIADITLPKEKTAIEAWGDVGMAIRKYGSYNEIKAMDSLTGVTKTVVRSMGFRDLCLSENDMADRAHFLKVYDTLAARERENALMLPSTREVMRHIQNGTVPLTRIK